MIANEVLKDHADIGAQVEQVVFAQVVSVEKDAPLVGVVQARQELHHRRLARAVLADQRQDLAGVERERQATYCPALGPRVAKADVFEAYALAQRHRERARVGRRYDLGRDLEE